MSLCQILSEGLYCLSLNFRPVYGWVTGSATYCTATSKSGPQPKLGLPITTKMGIWTSAHGDTLRVNLYRLYNLYSIYMSFWTPSCFTDVMLVGGSRLIID